LRLVFTVFRKELLDSFRDRRSLFSLFLFPLIGPLLVSLILTEAVNQNSNSDKLRLAVRGRENAPGLIAFLERQRIEIVPAPADSLRSIRENTFDCILEIPPSYPSQFKQAKSVSIRLISDNSRNESQATVRTVQSLVQHYSQTVGSLRLLAHGVNPALARPIRLHQVDTSTERSRAAIFLNLIPMFVLLAAFIGGMYTATDTTAGERERGSLEALLITPAKRSQLVIGKWLAATFFGSLTVLFTLGLTLFALSRVPLKQLGMAFTLGPTDAGLIALAVLPICFFTAALQMLVASFARSFKEAQTYLSLTIFAPMLPGLLTTLSPLKSEMWMSFVPLLGQQVIISDIIRGESAEPLRFLISTSVALAAALGLIFFTHRLFGREKILFGG
jgi:sodium transport system permease protein